MRNQQDAISSADLYRADALDDQRALDEADSEPDDDEFGDEDEDDDDDDEPTELDLSGR